MLCFVIDYSNNLSFTLVWNLLYLQKNILILLFLFSALWTKKGIKNAELLYEMFTFQIYTELVWFFPFQSDAE